MMKNIQQFLLGISAIALLVLVYTFIQENSAISKIALVVAVLSFTLGMGSISALKNYQYTAWIIVAVVAGMVILLPSHIGEQ